MAHAGVLGSASGGGVVNPWDDLVAAAVQGTARRPMDPAAWPSPLGPIATALRGDPAVRLLDAAAAATILRRAGSRSRDGSSAGTFVAAADSRPEVWWPVTSVLEEIPSLHAVFRDAMLELVVTRVAVAGQRFPHRWLPFLLDAAIARVALRDPVMRVAGDRGRWLAEQNPSWQSLTPPTREPPAAATFPRDPVPEWAQWGVADKVAALRAWSADPRLAESAALEVLLEQALDDRSPKVIAQAWSALRTRDRSAFAERAQNRLLAALTVRRGLLRTTVSVTLPPATTPADHRDGYPDTPLRTTAAQRDHLAKVAGEAPMSAWEDLGGPALLRAQFSDGGTLGDGGAWGSIVRDALLTRMSQEAAAGWVPGKEWIQALTAGSVLESGPVLGWLAPHLTEPERIRTARALLTEATVPLGNQPSHAGLNRALAALRMLASLPHPWPQQVLRDVTAALPQLARLGRYGGIGDLVAPIVLGEPVERLGPLIGLLPTLPDPGGVLESAVRVVHHRQTLERELPL